MRAPFALLPRVGLASLLSPLTCVSSSQTMSMAAAAEARGVRGAACGLLNRRGAGLGGWRRRNAHPPFPRGAPELVLALVF